MFVSKAAVVGGGTMGGEIAQAIAAADIPVVVKDIDQKFVDAAVEKARAVTEGQLARLVKKEKLTQEQADARLAEVMGLVTGTTTYEEFGDVDFVDRGGAGEDGDQAGGLPRARRGHPRPRDPRLQHLLALDHRDRRRRRCAPDKVVGFHFFYPASVMPLVEVIVGEDTSRGDRHRRLQLRPGDQEAADRLRRGARLRRQPHPDGDDRRDLARPGGAGPLAEGDRRGDRRRQGGADGPLLPHRPARPRHRAARRRAPERVLRRDLLRPPGPAAAGRRRQARRQVRRRGLLQGGRAERSPATPIPTPRSWSRCSPAGR